MNEIPDIQFTESMLKAGECPLCEGSRERLSEESPTGYEDCVCKSLMDFLGILGPHMRGVKSPKGKGVSPYQKYYGKNLWIHSGEHSVNTESFKTKVLGHVRTILRKEFLRSLKARREGGFVPEPEWCWLQSE